MIIQIKDAIFEYAVRNKLSEDIPVYSVTNEKGFCTGYFSKEVASKDKSTYKIVPKGYFAYNPSRINVGSIDWQNCEDKVIVSPLYVVFGVSEELDQQYLLHYLKSDMMLTYIKEYATGSVRDNLKLSDLGKFPINLRPLDEQRKIAAVLDKVSDLIAKRCQQLDKLDELIKARFVEMFGDEHHLDDWNCVSVGEVADICVGVVIKPTQYYTDQGGVPAFRSLNIGAMTIKNADWVYFTKEGHEKNKKSIVCENDVLVVRSGAPGTACVVTKEFSGYNAVDIIIAHPNIEKINSVFLAMFTNMPHGMNQIREKTGGAAQQHFNVGGYKELTVILPPIELQNQFAAFVEQTEKTKTTISESLQQLETLKKALMQEYFG